MSLSCLTLLTFGRLVRESRSHQQKVRENPFLERKKKVVHTPYAFSTKHHHFSFFSSLVTLAWSVPKENVELDKESNTRRSFSFIVEMTHPWLLGTCTYYTWQITQSLRALTSPKNTLRVFVARLFETTMSTIHHELFHRFPVNATYCTVQIRIADLKGGCFLFITW